MPLTTLVLCHSRIIIIITYPLNARVVGAPKMISRPVSSIFRELQACPYPGAVFPPLPLSALSSSKNIQQIYVL